MTIRTIGQVDTTAKSSPIAANEEAGFLMQPADSGVSGSFDIMPPQNDGPTPETTLVPLPQVSLAPHHYFPIIDVPETIQIGTFGNDLITGTSDSDAIMGLDGDDTIYGLNGDDTLGGGLGADSLLGGNGNDMLNGDEGNDILRGEAGNDAMYGGAGDDIYYVTDAGDTVFEFANEGTDKVYSSLSSYTLGANFELLELTGTGNINGTGNELYNRIAGNSGDNVINVGAGNTPDEIYANGGNDKLIGNAGNNKLEGGDGNDTLLGGAGNDAMYGGTGADTFVYTANSDSGIGLHQRDVINDFSQADHDILDFSAFDGNFTFRDTAAFTGTAHEINYTIESGNTIIHVDANGDGKTDFDVQLVGTIPLHASDFAL